MAVETTEITATTTYTLTVADIVVIERSVELTTTTCRNCEADFTQPEAITLQQYEYSEQSTDISMEDWSDSTYGEAFIPASWVCARCDTVIVTGQLSRYEGAVKQES